MIIDVSHHNGKLNWTALSKDIEAAIIRIGYGDDLVKQDDKQFLNNVTGCMYYGIPFGFYLYSYADTRAHFESEIEHIVRLITPYKNIMQLPMFYDLEQPTTESVSNIMAHSFVDNMNALGIRHGIYASEYWFNNYIDVTDLDTCLWVAKYGSKPDIGKPYALWQMTDKGSAGGHSPLDISVAYMDLGIQTTLKIKAGDTVRVLPDSIEESREYVIDWNGARNRIYFKDYTVREVTDGTVLLEKDNSIFTRLDINKVVKVG